MSLKDLKVGDKVVIEFSGMYASISVATITGITPKGFIKIDGGNDLYDPISGFRRGDTGYYKNHITAWTPEEQQKVDFAITKNKYQRLLHKVYSDDKVYSIDFYTKGIEHLKAILAEVDA